MVNLGSGCDQPKDKMRSFFTRLCVQTNLNLKTEREKPFMTQKPNHKHTIGISISFQF